jgi:P27 family predicted phage terminase small subunit
MTAALKLLRPQGRRNAPAADPIPEPPEHLDAVAKAKWVEIIDSLQARAHDQGVLDLLTLYAVEWSRWRSAEEQVAKIGAVVRSPQGFPQVNPWLSVARQAHDRLVRLSKRLGIASPSK